MNLPAFRLHPDPVASGSITASHRECAACGKARGYVYALTPYAEEDYTESVCPWCIADGTAHATLDATFVDCEALRDEVEDEVMLELMERTPGFASWQNEEWPVCCHDAAAFLKPVGIAEIRTPENYQWEGMLMGYIVHNMGISGGAAKQLLESLHRDKGPTAYLFRCLHCNAPHFHIDFP